VERRWYWAAILTLAISTPPCLAAEAPCFEIYPNSNSGPEGAILLNKCTGQSWLLFSVNSGQGNTTGWYPIPIDMGSDPEGEPKKNTGPGQAD
jgi:hypothetical protein